MTDRLHSTKSELPKDYRFGDARAPWIAPERSKGFEWRSMSENAAERLKPLPIIDWTIRYGSQSALTANVIEGEHFDTNRDHGDER